MNKRPKILQYSGSNDENHALLNFEHETFRGTPEYWGPHLFHTLLRKPRSHMLYAINDEPSSPKVTGLAMYWVDGPFFWPRVHLGKLAVHPDHRKRGIATALVNTIGTLSKRAGFRTMTLHVDTKNEPAKTLYAKLGFGVDDLIENYYEKGKHAYFMSCDLK